MLSVRYFRSKAFSGSQALLALSKADVKLLALSRLTPFTIFFLSYLAIFTPR
jgi:hypothetical protein